jgi:hypothetical protein
MSWAAGVVALILLAIIARADAAPPPDADPTYAPWFRSLKIPGTIISCCDLSDCRPVEYRESADHYQVLWHDRWLDVPPDRVLRRDNPTGSAQACIVGDGTVLCFVPESQS